MSAPAPLPETARALFSAVTDLTEDGIVGIDLQGQVHTWSQGAERIFGYSAEEMIGRTLAILMPGGTGAFTPVLDRLRQGQHVDRVEAVRIAKGNRLVHVSTAGTALRDANGQVTGAVAVVRDISERKRADLDQQATDARWLRWAPSKPKGFVTTATVSAPISFAIFATTAEAPVPVPPPIPHVMKTMSEP
jgi:PAS domain S-box-containing protein